ncbi:MAG: hypothetical protein ACI970_001168 [Myxococcota bacterium]|jgi:hypothetical protein
MRMVDDRTENHALPSSSGDVQPSADPDPLLAARAAIDEVEELPIAERAAVFEQVHQVVVEELRQLELG